MPTFDERRREIAKREAAEDKSFGARLGRGVRRFKNQAVPIAKAPGQALNAIGSGLGLAAADAREDIADFSDSFRSGFSGEAVPVQDFRRETPSVSVGRTDPLSTTSPSTVESPFLNQTGVTTPSRRDQFSSTQSRENISPSANQFNFTSPGGGTAALSSSNGSLRETFQSPNAIGITPGREGAGGTLSVLNQTPEDLARIEENRNFISNRANELQQGNLLAGLRSRANQPVSLNQSLGNFFNQAGRRRGAKQQLNTLLQNQQQLAVGQQQAQSAQDIANIRGRTTLQEQQLRNTNAERQRTFEASQPRDIFRQSVDSLDNPVSVKETGFIQNGRFQPIGDFPQPDSSDIELALSNPASIENFISTFGQHPSVYLNQQQAG